MVFATFVQAAASSRIRSFPRICGRLLCVRFLSRVPCIRSAENVSCVGFFRYAFPNSVCHVRRSISAQISSICKRSGLDFVDYRTTSSHSHVLSRLLHYTHGQLRLSFNNSSIHLIIHPVRSSPLFFHVCVKDKCISTDAKPHQSRIMLTFFDDQIFDPTLDEFYL